MGRITTHPGEILKEDVLPELRLSKTEASKKLGISRQLLHGILRGDKPMSPETCLKVARLAGGSPDMWLKLQAQYDLSVALHDKELMKRVNSVPALAEDELRV